MVALHLGKLPLFLRLLLIPLIGNHIKAALRRQVQGFAYSGKIQRGGLHRQRNQLLPLRLGQLPCGLAGRQNTDMVYVLKELKILEGIGGFESPPLLGLKGTEAPQIPLAIGAVAPRSLVKMPLGQ